MARVTLRLPDDLHRRLCIAADRGGLSLNQLIVVALQDSLNRDAASGVPQDSGREQALFIKKALGDVAIELDTRDLPPHLRPSDDLPDADTLRQRLPELSPPLSATIISDRADRF